MDTQQFDVAIVGMGPVGAAAAILFAEAGLRVAVIEKSPDIYPLPRAVGMDGEIVRAFQKLGYGEALNATLQPVRPGERAGFVNSKHDWLFGHEFAKRGVNGWAPILMFDQPELEDFLRDIAISLDRVEIFLDESVLDFRDEDECVFVRTSKRQLQASYLVACDGAASPTRKALNIGWHDLGYDHNWLVVDVTAKSGHTLTNDTVQVCSPDRIGTYVVTKDPYRRWEFKMNPGETAEGMLEDETIFSLLDEWTPRGTYEIRRKAVYTFHAATADRWRIGRVFLAGDAAHQTPPFLGQGMNAGMRDVINLSWKLPLVINGKAPEELLDTYESERLPHAQDLVAWAVAVGQLIEHLAAVELAEREGRNVPSVPPKQQSAGYGQGREAPPLRDGIVLTAQVSDEGSTGYLFSQPSVRNGEGQVVMLDELLGSGFSLVMRGGVSLSPASQAVVSSLSMKVVSIDGLTEAEGHFDRLFRSADAVIVRPDRYVFGHTTDELGVDSLVQQLNTALNMAL